jgi:hypothetical protein
MQSGRRPVGLFVRVTAGAFLCLGIANPVRPQVQTLPAVPAPAAQPAVPPIPAEPTDTSQVQTRPPQPAPAAQPAGPPIPAEPTNTSQVFPDGGFPNKPAAEGAIPDTTPQPAAAGPAPEATPQPGPGGLYAPVPPPSPDYSRPGVGVRPISDYAPPGLMPTDPQGGLGVPLYRPIPIPTPGEIPTELERDKFVTRGLFPGTYLVPGTNTSFKWYGFVRLDGIEDFNPVGGTDSFVVAQIPVPQGHGANFAANPRYSRLGLDTWTPTPLFDWEFHTRIEVDFFNGNNSGVFGSYPLRLRHAYVDFGPFRLGQTASTFMDYDVFPNVLDYQGPNGMVLMRQVIARVTVPLADQWHVAFAAEQPYSDIQWFENGEFVVNPGSGIITTAGAPRNVQNLPDFTGHVRYDSDFGHVQVSGILRKLTFQPADGSDMNRLGSGVNLTGDFHPWAWLMQSDPARKDNPTALERCRILGQYAVGRGIDRYLQDQNGLGLDAVFDPIGGFRALYMVGWFVCYEHWWTTKWVSNLCYSETFTALPNALPGDTYRAGKYAAVNLIWLPVPRLGIGIEYGYGEREDKDGQEGLAHRLQMGVQYNF